MAISVLNSAQSGSLASNSVTITSATAGNTLVFMASMTLATAASSPGFTMIPTTALYNSSASTVQAGYKIANGGETSVVVTGGGTVEGVCCWEIAGAPKTIMIDGPVATVNNLSALTGTITVNTLAPGTIVLIGVGATSGSGTISAWTGTNVATNISTASTRCQGGSFITTTALTNSGFTFNDATSRACAMLQISISPNYAQNNSNYQFAKDGGSGDTGILSFTEKRR